MYDYLAGDTPKVNVFTVQSPWDACLQYQHFPDYDYLAGDTHDVRYPNIDTREVLVTTYVREARQHRVCHRNATECPFKSPFQTGVHQTPVQVFFNDTQERYREGAW